MGSTSKFSVYSVLAWFAFFSLLIGAGCSYDGGLGEIECDGSSDCPDGASCVEGYCLLDDELPDAGLPDADDPDADTDVPDADCEVEDPLLECQNAGAACGEVTVLDSCDEEVTIDCDEFEGFGCEGELEFCDSENQCSCPDYDADELCDIYAGLQQGLACGELEPVQVCDGWDEFDPVQCGDSCDSQSEECASNICVPRCESDDDCNGEYCNLDLSVCVECLDNAHCDESASEVCTDANECQCQEPREVQQICEDADDAECGPVTDVCGATVDCGECTEPNFDCEDNACVCQPITTCGADQCGDVDDGCGGTIDCGGCDGNDVCNHTTNTCECDPITTCGADQCGDVDDGCGGTIDCAGCDGGHVCNHTTNLCECDPITTCDANQCGDVDDGCGGTIDCASCDGGHVCNHTTNLCECDPITTCADNQCGDVDDGCAGTIDCGGCAGDYNECDTGDNVCVCDDTRTVEEICESQNAECGEVEDACGDPVQCPDTCESEGDQCLESDRICVECTDNDHCGAGQGCRTDNNQCAGCSNPNVSC